MAHSAFQANLDLLLDEAARLEREGRISEAIERYAVVVGRAETPGEEAALIQALRHLAILRHRSGEVEEGVQLCERSYRLARDGGVSRLAALALNTLASFTLEAGELDRARELYEEALALCTDDDEIRGRIEQNLGVLANIKGDLRSAHDHYGRALEAMELVGNQRGSAIAYHNLGMVSADQQRWDDADHYFHRSHSLAESVSDFHLRGLCLLNHTEVHLARRDLREARRSAEAALAIFNELESQLDKADAYKMLGVVFRELGQPAVAESRLLAAVELADQNGVLLSQAEASRELAVLYQNVGRNQDALRQLNAAHRLFRRLDARRDLVDVGAAVHKLESTYMTVVRNWGESIESADSYTHGHCERVATYGLHLARALRVSEEDQTALRVGAYLHDVGKIRVPHEVLNKPGKLTAEEFEIIKRHPEWGVELLATIEFPWDILPIIRWHHERYDGNGYPDRLRGEEIPLSAQIICAADVYDALTTTRSYRPAMTREQALGVMRESPHWWREDVFRVCCDTFSRLEPEELAPSSHAA